MSRTVDERVVEMRFDNKHFEKNVKETMSTLEKLKQKLNLKDAAKGMEGIGAAAKNVNLSGISRAADELRLKFSGLDVVAVTALANITNAALNAGKRVAAAFTVEPIKLGFQEYETQINAVQTILANTSSKGTTLDEVNQALDELNHYADMTIYNFTEMTRNIGTFTAAGVDLDTSVSAIQGIANLAAVSGSTSQQASTAMYQLSQALAAGTVKLQDWNSVVNAGMGGEVFQNALKETARLHGVAIDQMIAEEGSFRETLHSGWLTSELLTETLSKFTTSGVNEYLSEYTGKSADAIAKMREQAIATGDTNAAYREMAKNLSANSKLTEGQIYELLSMSTTAEDAATKVKTFSQLMDTLKEAAQSGWTQTWEILIGDFEEAKELFTEVSETFGKIIEKSANARNKLLEGAMGQQSSGWEKLEKKIRKAGIASEDFQNALMDTARSHNVAVDKMVAEEGSFVESLKRGWMTADVVSETLHKFIDGAGGAAGATEDMTDKLSEFQDVVDQVIRGNFGNGEDRVKALTEAGYDYAMVQGLVNDVLAGGEVEVSKLSDAQLKNAGYTEKQIDVMRKLAKQAEETGTPLNELIGQMAKPSGRELLIDSFRNMLGGLLKAIGAVKDAWREVFPPMTSKQLYGIIEGLHRFSGYLAMTDDGADKLKRSMKGLFAVVKVVWTLIGGGFRIALKVIGSLLGMVDLDILSVTAAVGDAAVAFHDWLFENNLIIKGLQTLAGAVAYGIKAVASWVKGFLGLPIVQRNVEKVRRAFSEASGAMRKWLSEHNLAVEGFRVFSAGVANAVKMVRGWVKAFLELPIVQKNVTRFSSAFSSAFQGLGGYLKGGMERIREFIRRVREMDSISLNDVSKIFKDFKDHVASYFLDIGGRFNGIKEALRGFKDDLKQNFQEAGASLSGFKDTVMGFAGSVGNVLGENLGSILAVGVGAGIIMFVKKVGNALEKIAHPIEGFSDLISGLGKALKAYTLNIKAEALYKIAKAIAILVGSIVLLTLLDQGKVWSAVGVLGAVGAGLVGFSAAMGKLGKGKMIKNGGAMMKQMATAVLELSVAIAIVSKLDAGGVLMAVIAIDSMMLCFTAMVALSKFAGKHADKAGAMIQKMSAGVLKISLAIRVLSKLDPSGMVGAIVAIDSLMLCFAGMVALSKIAGKHADKAGTMIQKMSTGILMMSLSIALLSKLNPREVVGAIVAIDSLMLCFAGMVALSKIAGQHADKAGIMLQKMSAGILMLSLSIALLSGLEAGGILKAIVAIDALLLCFTALVAVSKFAGEHADKAGKMLLLMSGAILILSVAIGLLSLIKPDGLLRALGAIVVLEAVFGGLIAVSKLAKKCTSTVLVISVVIGMLAIALGALSMVDPTHLAAAAASLSAVMAAFGVLIASTSLAKKAKKSVGTIAVMTLVVAALGGILYMLSGLPVESTLGIAASLSLLLVSLSGACLILGAAGKFGSAAFVGIGALSALIAAVGTLMAAIGALVTEIPQVQTWLDAGFPVLEKIGYGIGSFFGNIIGGFSAGATSGLPQIGANLSAFMMSMMPFFMGIKMVTPETLQGVKALAETVLMLTAADLINGIASFITGGSSLSSFAAQLVPFGEAIAEYSNVVAGNVDAAAVTASANAGKTLAELATNLPNSGGLLGGLLGNNDIDDFGNKIVAFGDAIVRYSRKVRGAVNADAVINSANAGKALAELAANLPNSGGALGWWLGENDINDFADKIVAFGDAIVRYSRKVRSAVNKDAVINSANAGMALAKLSNALPNKGGALGWWLGENDIDDFADKIVAFGDAIVRYSRKVKSAVNKDAVISSADAGKALAALASEIPNGGGAFAWLTGEQRMDVFANNIVMFGDAIVRYSRKVRSAVKKDAIIASVEAGKELLRFAEGVPTSGGLLSVFFGEENSLRGFGKNLESFGLAMSAYYESIKGIVGTPIYMAVSAAKSVVSLAKDISGVNTDKMTDLGRALSMFGQSGIGEFSKAFVNSGDDMKGAASSLVGNFTTAMGEKRAALVSAAKDVSDTVVTALRNQYGAFHSAGLYLVEGFAKGIGANTFTASAKASQMANEAKRAAERTLQINSPSKVFEEIGAYVAKGFGLGISKNTGQAAKSAEGLARVGEAAARVVADSLNRGSKTFDEFVEKTDKDGNAVELTLERAADAFRKFRNSVKENIKEAIGVFDEWEEESDITGRKLMENLQDQILGIQEWAGNVRKLARRGIDEGLLKVLSDMGPSGAKYANALVKLSDKALKKMNALYRKRLSLDGKAASEIASSFLVAGQKAAEAFSKGMGNQNGMAAAVKSLAAKQKSLTQEFSKNASKDMGNATKYSSFGDAVESIKSGLAYGKGAFQKFVGAYLAAVKNVTVGSKAVKVASKALAAYGQKLYEQSDYYKEDNANIKEHKKELSALQKQRDKIQKQLKKANKSNTVAARRRARELKEELSEADKAIKSAKKQIKQDQKDVAAHTKEVFDELRSGLAESVSSFIDPLKASLDTGIDLFERFAEETRKVSTTKLLRNMKSQVDGISAWREGLKELEKKGLADGLLQKLKDMGPDGAKYVDAFLRMTAEELKQANETFARSENLTSETFLGNFTDSLDAAGKWADAMQKLAKMGVSQGLLEQLGDMGPDGMDYVNAILNMTPKQVEELNKKYAKSLKIPESAADKVISSFVYAGGEGVKGFTAALEKLAKTGTKENKALMDAVDKVGDGIQSGVDAIAKKAKKKAKKEGVDVGRKALEGLAEGLGMKQADKAIKEVKKLKKTVLKVKQGLFSVYEELGGEPILGIVDNVSAGLVTAIKANTQSVASAAAEMALGVYDAAKGALEIHSPSKKFQEIGEYADMGFSQGIASGVDSVCTTAVSTMGRVIDTVSDALENGIDINPTICPVLDLTEIQNGAGRISGMLDGVSLSGSIGMAQMTAKGMSQLGAHMDDRPVWDAINGLRETLKGLSGGQGDTYYNTFNIQGSSPREIADEVSHIIQQQVERRRAAWG